MRVALKIAYDGGAFFGHQRQPDRRTVEGECLAALRAGKILQNPRESFFRSASRTDRGVSAVGNVIAFDAALQGDAVVGVFNDHAEGVWAWAYSEVPPAFHPRHAIERWYRYHLYNDLSVDSLREVGALFLGDRDFRSFTSEPPTGPFALNSLDVTRDADVIVVDVRASSFRRGMVRRIVAAMVAFARDDVALDAVQAALEGEQHDFGVAAAEPLFLMDVSYGFPFQVVRKGKALDEWHALRIDAALRLRWLRAIDLAASA
ncbi:MAG: tRNA pseudouridine(38-40) synthase TruA [Methanobacteriota archaeon]|nr:MAG: tRNA pseudouridine(38-40) synthase TruA [Euryarchaeota archaeon]